MRRIVLSVILSVVIFFSATAFARAQSEIKLEFASKYISLVADARVHVSVTANRAPTNDMVFYYEYMGERCQATFPAGETEYNMEINTPAVQKRETYELTLAKGEGYALGSRAKTQLIVFEGLEFAMYGDGYAFVRPGKSLSVTFKISNASALTTAARFELRDDSGLTLASAKFSKDNPKSSFKFTTPADWTGIHYCAVWMGDRKLSDDFMAIMNTGDSALYKIVTDEKKLSVTIDCGSGAPWQIRRWMDLLDKYDAKATFFIVGKWAENNREVLKEIVERGHEIGNHSWSHKKAPEMNVFDLKAELDMTNQLIYEETGTMPTLFRAPYGSWNPSVVSLLNAWGYVSVQWTQSSKDSETGRTSQQMYNSATSSKVVPGAIVLFHNGSQYFDKMDDVFKYYTQTLGCEIVRVTDLMPEGEWTIDSEGIMRAVQ